MKFTKFSLKLKKSSRNNGVHESLTFPLSQSLRFFHRKHSTLLSPWPIYSVWSTRCRQLCTVTAFCTVVQTTFLHSTQLYSYTQSYFSSFMSLTTVVNTSSKETYTHTHMQSALLHYNQYRSCHLFNTLQSVGEVNFGLD